MFNKNLVLKEIGAQFQTIMAATQNQSNEMIQELIKHREDIEQMRTDKAEIVKQLILIDMMKSELLIKLSQTNTELKTAKDELKIEEKQLREKQVHRLYPEMFMKGAFEYDKEIDEINATNYKD